jgi:hypothetical protein
VLAGHHPRSTPKCPAEAGHDLQLLSTPTFVDTLT